LSSVSTWPFRDIQIDSSDRALNVGNQKEIGPTLTPRWATLPKKAINGNEWL
jgi:hypothetical protein